MSVSGDGSDHLLSEKEAVETLEKLFEAVSRLNGIKMQLAEYEDTSTWTDTFEENGTLYARFQGEVCEALRSSLAGHTDSQEAQSLREDSICDWESVSDIESDILDVFETLEDSCGLQSLVDFLFVEKDGKLYYSARSGSFGSSPYGWDLTTVKVVENTEDRVIFEGQWGFDRVTDAKLTMVKNPSGKWVLTRDYWGENITFGPEDAFFRAVEKGETCKLLFTSISEGYITLDFTDTIEKNGVTYARFVEFLHDSQLQWTSKKEVTDYFLESFEKPEDMEPLQKAMENVFIEENRQLYYCTDTTLNPTEKAELLPCDWKLLAVQEEKEDRIRLKAACWKAGEKESETRTLTVVKGTENTWR